MTEVALRRRARITALLALLGVPVGLVLVVFGPDHEGIQFLVILPLLVLVVVLQRFSERGPVAPQMFQLDDACVAVPRSMEGVVVALGWAAVGQLTGTAWASLVWLRRAPDPHGLFAHVMRDLNLASLVPLAVALVLAAVATVSLAQGRPYLRLYPDRLKAAGLFVTQVVPWSALSPLDAWTPAAPWVRRRGNEPILVFPLGRPELVTYRSRVPFAGWVARRRTKGQWLALSHRRLAVTVEGITEATREYAQRANRVPDAR